ncbi:MAG: 50S ribosomal protein L15 [Oscillospiraceae bacterium]|nr:50S ribosomal protein L15 [Oscillospiraceae bacterium]
MKLYELSPADGSRKDSKRKGRGAGSGNGKTAGYGHKGQLARSGHKPPYFEGGQLPLIRRLPKRGFTNAVFKKEFAIVNVCDLERKFEAGAVVDAEALVKSGLVKKPLDGIKVLGNGELSKALTVQVAAFSASAKEKIEKAGGKAEVV